MVAGLVFLGPVSLFFNRTSCPADVAVTWLRETIYYEQWCLQQSAFVYVKMYLKKEKTVAVAASKVVI